MKKAVTNEAQIIGGSDLNGLCAFAGSCSTKN